MVAKVFEGVLVSLAVLSAGSFLLRLLQKKSHTGVSDIYKEPIRWVLFPFVILKGGYFTAMSETKWGRFLEWVYGPSDEYVGEDQDFGIDAENLWEITAFLWVYDVVEREEKELLWVRFLEAFPGVTDESVWEFLERFEKSHWYKHHRHHHHHHPPEYC